MLRLALRSGRAGSSLKQRCFLLTSRQSSSSKSSLTAAFGSVDGDDFDPSAEDDNAFLDSLLIENFDDAIADAGSTGTLGMGGAFRGAGRGQGGEYVPERTQTYILDDYRKSMQQAQVSGKTLVKPDPWQYGDGVSVPSQMVDDMPKMQKPFSLDIEGSKDVTTADVWFNKFSSPNEDHQWILRHIAQSRVSNMTAKGKTPSLKSLIVIGNGNGTAGFGVGKGQTMMTANNRAIVNAKNNLIWLDFKDGRGLFEPLIGKHNSTRAMFWPRPHGAGHRVGGIMRAVCECFGLMDVTGKIVGRNNPYSVMQAIFDAFQGFRTEEEVALTRGRRIIDINNINPRYSRDPYD